MSDQLAPPEAARRLRQRVGDAVLVRRARGHDVRMHVPDGETPACVQYDTDQYAEPRSKPLAALPPGYYPWCRECAAQVLDDEIRDGKLRHPGIAADGGEDA